MAYPISGGSSLSVYEGRRPRTSGGFSWGGVSDTHNQYPYGAGNPARDNNPPPRAEGPWGPEHRSTDIFGRPTTGPSPTSPNRYGVEPGPTGTTSPGGIDFGPSDGSGGGGGGGGFTRASAPGINTAGLFSTAHLDAALADLGRARQEALDEKAGLDATFEQRMADLREQFSFTETAEEQRMLSRMLAELEAQRSAGYQAIGQGYQAAVQNVQARGQDMRASAAQEQAAVGDLYDGATQAVQATGGALNQAYDAYGGGALGVGSDGGAPGTADWVGLLASEGAAEQALTGRLGAISAEGADWMADTLQGQGLAQQGDLNRLAMSTSAAADMEHQRRVQDRIFQERMAFNDLYGQTRSAYDSRGWQLGDQSRQFLADQGNLRFQGGEAAIDRRMQVAMQQASMAAAASRANASAANAARSAGGASGSQYTVPDMMAALQDAPTQAYRNTLGAYLVQNHGLNPQAAAQLGVNVGGTTTSGQQSTAALRNAMRQ